MFCRLESSVSELVDDKFLRFLHEGKDEFTVSEEIEGPMTDSSGVTEFGGHFLQRIPISY